MSGVALPSSCRVALPLPAPQPYTYAIPPELADRVVPGTRVVVPVRGREMVGLVTALADEPLPDLKPVLLAQFWLSIPIFILAEANLGILGLGVAEPLPSWGSLLREIEDLALYAGEFWKLASLALLVLVVSSFELLLSRTEVSA